MDLKEILAELLKQPKDAVVAALQSDAQPIFQAVYDKGHGAATARHQADKATLDGKIVELQGQLTTSTERIRALEASAPGAAELQKQYETRVREMEEKHKTELLKRDTQLNEERIERAFSDLRSKLKGRVDGDFVPVLVQQVRDRKRLRLTDGKVEALQADSGIPFVPSTDGKKDGLDLLADELFTGTPLKFQLSTVDSGSGADGGGGGGGSGATSTFDNIRKDAKERNKPREGQSAKERMGVAR